MRKSLKKALSLLTASAMSLSLVNGIPFSKLKLGVTASADANGASLPTFNQVNVVANGTPIVIESGTSEGTSAVWYGTENEKIYVNPSGAQGDDLSDHIIVGGSVGSLTSDTSITMNGGEVASIVGGCRINTDVTTAVLDGNVSIRIYGGSVNNTIYGNGYGAYNDTTGVNGDIYIGMYGGSAGSISCGAFATHSTTVTHTGKSFVSVAGGTVWDSVRGFNQNSCLLSVSGDVQFNDYEFGSFFCNTVGTSWDLKGQVEIPSDVQVSVGSFVVENGESLDIRGGMTVNGTVKVYKGGVIENNGTVCNNGTIYLSSLYDDPDGNITGNPVTGEGRIFYNMPYITAESVNTLEVYSEEKKLDMTSKYKLKDGKLYLDVPNGYVYAVLNGNKYHGLFEGEMTALKPFTTPVTGYEGTVPQTCYPQENIILPAKATPTTENYSRIIWSIVDAGTTGAVITDGVFRATDGGTAVIRGRVANGLDNGVDYVTENITITVKNAMTKGYLDRTWNGTKVVEEIKPIPAEAQVLTDETGKSLSDGWYIVREDITLSDMLDIVGDVHLIICDGCTVNATKGICVEVIKEEPKSLTIYCQEDETGEIITTGKRTTYSAYAGIGGPVWGGTGDITIKGGNITANGSLASAGIGRSYRGRGGNITIYGGTIKATGNGEAPGIGGSNGSVTIYGGNVTAIGGGDAPGIGGQSQSDGIYVGIHGGTVTAIGGGHDGNSCPGIGAGQRSGGYGGSGSSVTITGGNVYAKSGESANYEAPAIGGSVGSEGDLGATGTIKNGSGEDIFLNTLTVYGIKDNAEITELTGVTGYNLDGMYALNKNKLYVYLPENSNITAVKAGSKEYTGSLSGKAGDYYPDHRHSWEYEYVNSTTINAVCRNEDCYDTEGNTIVISSEDKTFSGMPVTATVTNNFDSTDYSNNIVYKNSKGETVAEAVNADAYTATLTLGEATISTRFRITKKSVTVTADDLQKTYGEPDPDLSFTAEGLIAGDTLVGALSREEGETAGTYSIKQGTLTNANNPNYSISFTAGVFTINKSDVAEVSDPIATTIMYGQTLSESVLTDGWVWTDEDIVPYVNNNGYTAFMEVDADNFDYSDVEGYADGKITRTVPVAVEKATVTITANDKTSIVGNKLPEFDYEVMGLVNGDELPVEVKISCSTDGNALGSYDIEISGDSESDNYKFIYENGKLTVMIASAPENVKATAQDTKNLITWNAVNNATKYRIQRHNGTSWTTIAYPTATSYTDTNVTEGNTYKYRVLAYVGGAWGKISAVAEVRAYSTIPRDVKATAGEGSVKLSWKAVENATKYRVQRQNGTTWSTVSYPNTTSYTDSKLTIGKEYKYRVLAYVNGAWGKLSETASAVPVPYTSVQQLKATESVGRIILSWESLEGATKYRVQRLNGTSWTTISYPTATTYTDKDVANGKAYKYRVLAYIDGSWRKASEPITATPLKAPENIKATAVDGGIEISWDEVVDATKYRIQRGNGTIWCTIVYTTATSYIDTDVRDGTAYSYRVLVYIDGEWSTVSLPATATA